MLFNLALIVASFFFMEFVAWFVHKYVMHGILWNLHASHHTPRKGIFEKNDLFAVIFGVPAVLTVVIGSEVAALEFLFYIGLGISAYGLFYFIFHDVIVHRRIKIRYKAKNPYMKRIMHAHYVHHEVHTKKGAESFGFLYAPKKYAEKKLGNVKQ